MEPTDWDQAIGRVIRATGWTLDYVLHSLDITGMKLLYREWAVRPPLAEMVAAFLGFTGKSGNKNRPGKRSPKSRGNEPGSTAAAAAALQQAGFRGVFNRVPKA